MYLTTSPIDLAALLLEARPGDGALCLFVGVVRDENDGLRTTAIQYEAYGPMAEAEMARLADALSRDFPAVTIRMQHRVGLLSVGEASVAIAAVSPHRAEAFAACRAAIDRVKATVPIWKKEFHPDGSSGWVDPTVSPSGTDP
ncbi:MAG TPA: molybdenum cofactor biosynthesis protein MoaE [Thermoanaerobaculia bacterium]|jgi:molybdopterin synthase catalytic subunit|nr:molybdenum cofactor biosynthesis protein MoaE [Thermoanaerobaculia bacterium]